MNEMKMQPRASCLLFILFLCLFYCSGCWDRKELKTQGIVAGMGVDYVTGSPGKYLYTFQVIKPDEVAQPKGKGGGGGGGETPVWIGTSAGRTPFEAGRNIAFQSSRRMFFSHDQALIFGQDAAREGVRPILDHELRFVQIRPLELILIAKGTAKEVLEVPGGLEKIPAFDITGLVAGSKYTSEAIPVTLNDFFQYLVSKTRAPVAPQIEVFTAGTEKRLRLSGTAVFKKDHWIGELDRIETRGLLWALGQIKHGVVNIPSRSGGEAATAEIITAGSKIRPEIRHGKVLIRIQINTEGNLQDILAPEGLTDPDKMNQKLHELEKLEATVIRQEIRSVWGKARRLNADIFGFGEAVHRRYPRQWRSLEPQWDRIFPRLALKIEVNTTLKRAGEIIEPAIPLPK
jgi:spore germination protein KC